MTNADLVLLAEQTCVYTQAYSLLEENILTYARAVLP